MHCRHRHRHQSLLARSARIVLFCATALVGLAVPKIHAEEVPVYLGTYTRGENGSKGIYLSLLDLDSGTLSEPKLAAETPNPSFLALHPNGNHLYAVSEISNHDGKKTGAVSAWSIDPATGLLTLLNTQPSGGPGPCHVSVDATGSCVLVANYGGGSCAALGIEADGSLRESTSFIQHEGSSVHPKRQTAPHAHSANPGPNNRFAFVADLGLDKVLIYEMDAAKATLTPAGAGVVAPGAGPRHFAFHPGGKWAYVINELTRTVTAFAFEPESGALTEMQTITTLPEGAPAEGSTAEVLVHPSGKFVYGSNRGHDTIAVFAVDPEKGTLTPVEHEPIQGSIPRNFGIDPTGRYLLAAGQQSNTIAVFTIDQETGALDYTGNRIELPSPVCIKFGTPRK